MTEIEEIERGDHEAGVRGHVGKLHDYFRNGSLDNFTGFLTALQSVEGGTISRTEAALLLGCSRQRIHQLVRAGEVECWEFHGGFIHDVTMYSELSVLDLLTYAHRIGRPVPALHAMKYVEWRPQVKAFYNQHSP